MRKLTPTFPLSRLSLCLPLLASLAACSLPPMRVPAEVKPSNVNADATLTPATRITRDLVKLPAPAYKVPVAVYAFRDQSGQFKPSPDSNLSNAVTQGAASLLVKALLDSGWYLPIEREGFQNLLNERRVARAIEVPADKGKPGSSYPQLLPAHFILEGGIVGYESNVRTGGQGANLLGVGAETKYRVDQVTVNLRSVDVRTGQVVNSVSVTKTIFSHEVSSSVYKFISYKTLLQAEGGYSTNEPSQLAVKEAVESAVIHLTLQGVRDRVWSLNNPQDWFHPLVQGYMREAEALWLDPDAAAVAEPVPMRAASLVRAPQPPILQEPALAAAPAAPVALSAPIVPPAAPAVAVTPAAPVAVAAPVPPRVVASPLPAAPLPAVIATPVVAPTPAAPAPQMVQAPAAPAPQMVQAPVPAPVPAPAQPLARETPPALPLAATKPTEVSAAPVVAPPPPAPAVVKPTEVSAAPVAAPIPPAPPQGVIQPTEVSTAPVADPTPPVAQPQVQAVAVPVRAMQPAAEAMRPFISGWGRPKPLPKETSEQDSWLFTPRARPVAHWAVVTPLAIESGVN